MPSNVSTNPRYPIEYDTPTDPPNGAEMSRRMAIQISNYLADLGDRVDTASVSDPTFTKLTVNTDLSVGNNATVANELRANGSIHTPALLAGGILANGIAVGQFDNPVVSESSLPGLLNKSVWVGVANDECPSRIDRTVGREYHFKLPSNFLVSFASADVSMKPQTVHLTNGDTVKGAAVGVNHSFQYDYTNHKLVVYVTFKSYDYAENAWDKLFWWNADFPYKVFVFATENSSFPIDVSATHVS